MTAVDHSLKEGRQIAGVPFRFRERPERFRSITEKAVLFHRHNLCPTFS